MTLTGPNSLVLLTAETGGRNAQCSLFLQHNTVAVWEAVCQAAGKPGVPGWYFSVYPARRPLLFIGGPH